MRRKSTITTEEIQLTNLTETRSLERPLTASSIVISEFQPTVSIEPENQDEAFPDGGFKAYSVVLGSFIGLVANFGTLNSIGAIQAYVATHQLEGVKTSTISWIFSIYLAVSFANTIFVGPFFDVKGATWPLVLGTILVFGGFMAVANSKTVPQFILSLSICVGLGNSLNIAPLVGVLSHWFNVKRGAAMGIATVGGSVGGMVIPLMLKALYAKVGFVWAIRCLAFFCLGCMLCAILLCRERVSRKLERYDHGQRYKQIYYQFQQLFEFKSLLDPKYSFFIVGIFAVEVSMMSLLTFLATYAIAQGMKESDSYVLLTVFNATGILGRLLPGYVSDKLGHFNIMILMLIGFSASLLIIWLPFGYNFGALYAFSAICGFFSSSILSLTPACLAAITPVSKFGQRYGLMYFFVSAGNLFGIPLSAAIIGEGSKHSYDMFAVYCGVFAVVGTSCLVVSRYYIVGLRMNVKI
ncbi:uncharacterized protein J8A68_000364 [[Candida] subhashii]|uniref:Major facilitator superfamily (MFS) profile domain-containing protein n=1 Tax=[Candida] subhashii TaxID=561895 RepID=A0A8J5UMH6_9ASCO|nr:uncharacterized protein J8A68_000364 [[Candida] subhashii]KAG7666108.1 hypothetical protein J8A68_000364 [[Candida] subhashii]